MSWLTTIIALLRFPPLDPLPVGAGFENSYSILYSWKLNVPQMYLLDRLLTRCERVRRRRGGETLHNINELQIAD
jgi:hypothetical protein